MTIPPILSGAGLWGLLQAYLAPLSALLAAVAGAVACRGRRSGWLPAVGAASAFVGWGLLVLADAAPRTILFPRTTPEFLLLPAAVAAAGLAVAHWAGGRIERWTPVALAAFAGWWLAAAPAARPEFFRVWLAVGLLAWVLSRGSGGLAARSLAAGLALWGGLAVAGAPPVWMGAGLVAGAASAGLLAAGLRTAGAALPAAVLAIAVAGADLGAGRLVRGGLNAVDVACLAASGAPVLAGLAAPRAGKRLGRAAPLVASIAVAVLAVALVWLASRLMRR